MDKNILAELRKKKWYLHSSPAVKNELKDLPLEFHGFLADLAKRKSFIGRVEILRLLKILRGNYLIIPVFEVRSLDTNEVFTYEFVSWKFGRFPGYKGIILVEVKGRIKYFIVKYGAKFPIGADCYDSIGTFYSPDNLKKTITVPNKIKNHLRKFLGLPQVHFKKFIDLGILNPDPGMSNNHIDLFAVVIDDDNAQKIDELLAHNPQKSLVLGYELEIVPVTQLHDFIKRCNDGFFLACIARLFSQKVLEISG